MFLILQTAEGVHRGSFLSFGSRRSSVVSSYGNTPTFIRRSFSSNGMLEYTVEQAGGSKLKDRSLNKLPLITKEEKENELIEEEPILSQNVKELKQKDKDDSFEDFYSFRKISDLNKKSPKVEFIPEESEAFETTSKNRKIFSHYDMPLSKKSNSQKEVTSSLLEAVSDSDINKSEEVNTIMDNSDIVLSNTVDERIVEEAPNNYKIKDASSSPRKICKEESNSEKMRLPKIINETSTTSTKFGNESKSIPLTASEQITLQDNNTNSADCYNAFDVKRSLSISEKNDIPFSRVSDSRFSLKNLPLRNPTPPKKSPRKSSKRDRVVKGCSDSVIYQKETIDNSSQNFELSNVVLPLASSKSDMEHPENEVSIISKLSNVNINDKSLQSLDDTPLFIVEEGDPIDKLPLVPSSKLGLQNTNNDINDSKIKNFIVVRSSDSNSLGLAPISSRNRRLSSSSTASNRSKLSTTSNYFSQSVERSSSTNTRTSKYSSSSTTSTSYYSSKQTTQIKLLKYKKSDDESFVIPPPRSNGSNYLITKGRILSSPFERNIEHDANSIECLEETNRSRLCSVM